MPGRTVPLQDVTLTGSFLGNRKPAFTHVYAFEAGRLWGFSLGRSLCLAFTSVAGFKRCIAVARTCKRLLGLDNYVHGFLSNPSNHARLSYYPSKPGASHE